MRSQKKTDRPQKKAKRNKTIVKEIWPGDIIAFSRSQEEQNELDNFMKALAKISGHRR